MNNLVSKFRSAFGSRLPLTIRKKINDAQHKYSKEKANLAYLRRDLPSVSASPEAPQHILFVVVDALRADAVTSEYTEFLNELGGASAVAPAPWTFPSVSSIFTGQYPHNHGAMRQSDDPENFTDDEVTLPPRLPESTFTLPEFLGGAGYDTFGAFSFPVPFLAMKGRFRYHSFFPWQEMASAPDLIDTYLNWIDNRKYSRTFAYLHLGDLHEPVDPPEKYWQKHGVDKEISAIRTWQFRENSANNETERYREHRKRLYHAALDFVDDELANLSTTIQQELENVELIVTSDHGEAFWEHESFDAKRFYDPRPAYSVGHDSILYESVARVPLLSTNTRFEEPASLIDITPSILSEAGMKFPENIDGYDHNNTIPQDRILLIESTRHGSEKEAAYKQDRKLIVSRGDDQEIGFKLPDEKPTKLSSSVKIELVEALPEWPDGGEDWQVSGEVRQQLENLGYK